MNEIIEFLGGATLFSALLGYLGKTAIEAYLASDLAQHKATLERITTEHSIRFQQLHTERADAIKDIYAKLVALDQTLGSTLREFQLVTEQSLREKVEQLGKDRDDLRAYFLPRRIFFDEATSKLIDSALDVSKEMFFDITTYPVDPTSPEYDPGNVQVAAERRALWAKARAAHRQDFAELKRKLERDFRMIFGIAA